MVEIITDPEALAEHRLTRFRILVCVDGSEESYKAVNYAAEVGKGKDADIVLLYVRPLDQGLRTGKSCQRKYVKLGTRVAWYTVSKKSKGRFNQ